MATESFHFEDVSGKGDATIFLRVFNAAGEVLDFADDTFKSLASGSTPYLDALEKADMAGSGRSGYVATLDLAKLNTTGAPTAFFLKFFDDSGHADTANPISDALSVRVQFGKLSGDREEPVYGMVHASVTSTAGNTAHLTAWLIWRGALVDLTGATCAITVRELGGSTDLFAVTEADKLGATAVINNRLELTYDAPGFSTDRMYAISGTVTVGGVVYPVEAVQLVLP